jgi:hypothetical protein
LKKTRRFTREKWNLWSAIYINHQGRIRATIFVVILLFVRVSIVFDIFARFVVFVGAFEVANEVDTCGSFDGDGDVILEVEVEGAALGDASEEGAEVEGGGGASTDPALHNHSLPSRRLSPQGSLEKEGSSMENQN